MKKKAIKYTIILLVVPLILSLSIAIATDNQGFNKNSGYDGINISNNNKTTTIEEIKRSNTYIYFSLFGFLAISGITLVYIKQKRGI